MVIELGFDDIPADYLRAIADRKRILRKLFGHEATMFLTPRRIVLRFRSRGVEKEELMNLIRHRFREMRWLEGDPSSFVRPLRWILALDGGNIFELGLFGVRSGDYTFTHRALGNRKVRITSEEDYFHKIYDECRVEVSHQRRREKIERFLVQVGVDPQEYQKLVDMAVFTTEFPEFVSAEIEVGDVPPRILEKILTDFVYVFPIKERGGDVFLGDRIKGFVAVVDNPEPDRETIKEGYIFVIRSRSEDAEFYIREDMRVPMSQRVNMLSEIVFNEGFGSFYDRAVFVSELAVFIGKKMFPELKEVDIRRASMLARADITTGLCREFPEHQGYIGMFYLVREGESREISSAVFECRLPERPEDPIPSSELGILLSLADKLAHVFLAFICGLTVTSEEDPFGIRRAARSAIRTLIEGKLDLDLAEVADFILSVVSDRVSQRGISDPRERTSRALEFVLERVEVLLSESFRKDIAKAVMKRTSSPFDAYLRAKALAENDIYPMFYVARRIRNIIEQAREKGLVGDGGPEHVMRVSNDRERELLEIAGKLEAEFFVEKKRYEELLRFFDSVREKIDEFFNSVVVLSENEDERNTRLGILMRIHRVIDSFADFSVIEKPSQLRR